MENAELREEFVPWKSRIWVSAADGSVATLAGLVFNGGLTYYFTRWRGLDGEWAALVWLLFGIWNAVNDPLFGYISDKTKSSLGRRIPYIRYGAPLYALAFVACWLNWWGTGTDQVWMFIQLLFLLFAFDTLYTAIATSLYIMPYEMALSNKARSSIFVWKILFQLLATAVPLIVLPMIQPGPGEDATFFRFVMLGFGVAAGLIVFFSTFFYQEKHFQQEAEQFPFLKSLIECFKNRSFLIFEIMSFTIIYVQTSLMQGVLYYFDEIDVPGTPLYAALGIGVIIGVFIWVNTVKRKGVKWSMQTMSAIFGVGCLIVSFGGYWLAPAIIGFLLFGLGFAGGMYLIPLMNGDVIDKDEDSTGLRREGMYAGVNSFVTKPAISIAQAVFVGILARFGYDNALAKGLQPASAETGILIAWTLVPGILLLLCAFALRWYPLDGAGWEATKQKLALIHKEKERRFLEAHGLKMVE